MERSNQARFAPYLPRSHPGDAVPPAGIVIRPAGDADVPSLAAIARERDGGDAARLAAGFGAELAGERGARLILVAVRDGGVVAFGRAAHFTPGADAPANTAPAGWYLGGVIVSPAHRRLGIGAELTRRRLEWIAARADAAYYFVNARNLASIALHERFGFVEVTRDFVYPGVTFAGGVGILFRAVLPGFGGGVR